MAIPTTPSTSLAQLTPATTAATALTGIVTAVPTIVGLLGGNKSTAYTIGYQPQLPPSMTGQNPLLITTQPPPAFQFHYEGEQTVTIQSDITDHFIEDNTAIQDQWAIKPEIITTHGFIGELNDVPPPGLDVAKQATATLSSLGAYVPGISATALLAYNEAFFLYQTANNAVNAGISAISSLSSSGGEAVVDGGAISNAQGITNPNSLFNTQSKQQQAFQQFYGYLQSRTFFTVQTPWAVFTNCAIQSLRAIQDAETNVITDFEVTFKTIKTAVSSSTQAAIATARLIAQAASQVNFGFVPSTSGPSLLSSI